MGKPENIRQDVWDEAKAIVFEPYLFEWEGIAAVAAAILAAEQREREACAVTAETTRHVVGPKFETADWCAGTCAAADAIRNRTGEPS